MILNDMIKVKGQVCEVAALIISPDQTLADMSRLLFNELSKRSNNPVYNLIPDVVGQMSVDESIKAKEFKTIMSFLLSFITKDKQSDGLVDKLVKRFEAAPNIKVKRDLAFCIGSLKVTEKSIKILLDQHKLYHSALYDDDVYGHFQSVLKKGKSFASANMKAILAEFESKLNESNEAGASDFNAAKKAEKAKAKAKKREEMRAERKKLLRERREKQLSAVDEVEEEDFIEFAGEKKAKGAELDFDAEGENDGGVLGNAAPTRSYGGKRSKRRIEV